MTKPLDVGALPVLPACFEFAMEFLGSPEDRVIRDYVALLRAELEASQRLAADRLEQMQADRAQALVWRGELEASRLECERLRVDAEKFKGKPGELPKYITQCFGCEGFPSGRNNPCEVCGRSAVSAGSSHSVSPVAGRE